MKVLINAISAKQGGILTYTRNLMRSLVSRRVNAIFAVPQGFEPEPGVNLLPMSAINYNAPARLAWEQLVWRVVVKKIKPDVLFSSANFSLLYPPVPQILLLREGGLFDPYYLSNFAPSQGLRLSLMRRTRRKLMLMSAKHSHMVMTPTEELRRSVLQWAPEIEDRIVTNWYGTLENAFRCTEDQRRWRADGTLRILYVSIYYAHKNPGVLTQAVTQMNQSGDNVRARISMTMDEILSTPGGTLDAFRMQAGIDSGQIDTGRHPYNKLPDLYHQNDVFVFPSVSETFGHPMVEAMAAGLPMVVADHPVNREICGDAALYFSPFHVSELIHQLQELDANPLLRDELIQKGRSRVLACFTWDAHVDRLCDLFEQVASGRYTKMRL